jgi:hypothetical protein
MPAASGTISLATAAPQLGQPIQFACAVSGLHGKQRARIYVEAKQDGVVVYGEAFAAFAADDPAHNGEDGIVLGGGSSDWLNDTPPADAQVAADCTARLFYFDHPPSDGDTTLDTVAFSAAGL